MKAFHMQLPRPMMSTAVFFVLSLFCFSGTVAQAASPAWKVLAVTGPSNLPPKQSEVQRLTVEAQGGTFKIGRKEEVKTVQTTGLPVFLEARLKLIAGSATATIESISVPTEGVSVKGKVQPGDRVSVSGGYEGTTIVSCSADCESAGSTLELSEPATVTESQALRQLYTREVQIATGGKQLQVGDQVEATYIGGERPIEPFYPPGTTVTAVGAGVFTLSNPTTKEYDKGEGFLEFTAKRVVPSELTGPIPFGAPAADVQSELEALPAFGAGSVAVVGRETPEAPYFVEFAGAGGDGPLAFRNVSQLEVDSSALTGQTANANVFTTVPGGPGTGEIVVDPANVGAAASKGLITLTIGPLPVGVFTSGKAEGPGWTCPEVSGSATVVCTLNSVVRALTPMEAVRVPVMVEPTVASNSSFPVRISGGGATPDTFQVPVVISAEPASFATRAFWAAPFDAEGQVEAQAGAHPESVQTFFLLNTVRAGSGQIVPAGLLNNANFDLPPGFIGNPLATPRCPQQSLASVSNGSDLCNRAMKVGLFGVIVSRLTNGAESLAVPIYNDVPAKGAAAEFTTLINYPYQSFLGSVRSDEDFGIRVTAPNVANAEKVFGSYAEFDGRPSGNSGKAFLTNPSDCAEEAGAPPITSLNVEAYEIPGVVSTSSVSFPEVTGCDKLRFTPSFALAPSTTQGSGPAGASADLHLPQEGLIQADQLAQPQLKKAVVTLPEGFNVNPSSANGLASCTETQMGYLGSGAMPNPTRFNEAPVDCPDASKLGTVQIKTPLVDASEEELHGTIYLAAPEANPFGSLLAVYLVIESERFGVTLKLPGKIEPDPQTGRLTATFDNNPQIPFEDLKLSFRGGGPRSTFATPEVCGHYATTGSLEPWSAPESGPPAPISEGGFDVSSGCSASSSARPFGPSLEAGTFSTQAGGYSPLVIKVSRKDGEQELKSLDFSLPKGLLGRVAGIPYCSEAAIRAAESNSGKAEQASPSCPAASRIGSVDTAAGVGTEPLRVPGNVYLAGPYKGAPLSSVVVTPALAGPFDLGVVVIRAPLYVDPETAEITAKSDPIPTILRGIPLKVRSVAISLDRPGFTLNPTSCEPMLITASILGSNGQVAKPQNRFQVGGCDKLRFKPKLKISLKGSTTRTGHPGLKAVLTYPKKGAYANIRRAQVNLPHSVFLDQGNLSRTCTKPVLLEGKCPANTIYGRATAWTPLLAKPLEGPVYLVGGYGFKLPALVADLNGQLRVVLKGKVDTGPNRGIRNTFEAVPDAPVSRFVLNLKGGKKYGLLENSENLCAKPQRAIARLTGQNGKVQLLRPIIADRCGRGSNSHHKKN